MLCAKCNKNMAVVFVKKIENGHENDEGYCLTCAKELGIKPVNDLMNSLGISDANLKPLEGQLQNMFEIMSKAVENGEMPDDFNPEEMENMPFFKMIESKNNRMENDKNEVEEPSKEKTKTQTKEKKIFKKKKYLDSYGINLSVKAKQCEIDRVIGRNKEIERVVQILNRRTKNNPCLIGEPGVGKTAIAEGLALRIVEKAVPAKLLLKEVYLLDFTALVAGTQFRGQFEARVKGILDEVKSFGNIILVIDEIHNIAGVGNSDGALSAANILKPALTRGDLQIIGSTTLNEYRKYIEKDAALERRLQPIIVEEATVCETIEIMKGIKKYYEDYHKIILTDAVITQAVLLSKRYISGRFLPDKAIDVIDEAGSLANLGNETLNKLTILNNELLEVQSLKENAVSADSIEDYQKAADLKIRECRIKEEISQFKNINLYITLTTEDVAGIVEQWSGVPVKKITKQESSMLMGLEESFKKKIIGQDKAVESVAKAIRRKRAGIETKIRPASFVFVGPTGVGKTEFVKVLTAELFGSEDSLVRLDMTEYSEQHSVSKMIGSPPGYVGYDEAGQLTEKVRRKPYSVVLFDEIEKAHSGVFNILLQILDEGKLTDSQGRVVSFENTVIVLTSNAGIGSETESLGFISSSEDFESRAKDKLKKIFKPELLNRIDEIAVFNMLSREACLKIVDIMLCEIEKSLENKGIQIEISEEVKEYIVKKGYSEKYGARELRRTIQKNIGDLIAEKIVVDGLELGASMKIGLEDDKVIIG